MQDPNLGRLRKDFASLERKDEQAVKEIEQGYVDLERHATLEDPASRTAHDVNTPESKLSLKERDRRHGRVVDVVLSDMSEPWDQTTGFHKRSLSDPYFRMANTSGIAFKDHADSMVSCQRD